MREPKQASSPVAETQKYEAGRLHRLRVCMVDQMEMELATSISLESMVLCMDSATFTS